jgi:hypothetical protein
LRGSFFHSAAVIFDQYQCKRKDLDVQEARTLGHGVLCRVGAVGNDEACMIVSLYAYCLVRLGRIVGRNGTFVSVSNVRRRTGGEERPVRLDYMA